MHRRLIAGERSYRQIGLEARDRDISALARNEDAHHILAEIFLYLPRRRDRIAARDEGKRRHHAHASHPQKAITISEKGGI